MASCVSLAGNQECIDDWFFGFGGGENLGIMESRRDQLPGSPLGDHTQRHQAGDHRPTARQLPIDCPPAYSPSTAVADILAEYRL
jgi:hypothetical protein